MPMLTNALISVLSILISVAFYTMFERKVLSYIQIRKGPNKVGITGILQPFSDAIKLFNKSIPLPLNINPTMFILFPALSLLLSLMIWPCMPLSLFNILDCPINSLILMFLSSVTVYSSLMMGWASNSKYSHLGSIRSVAQMISYEINFFLIIMTFLIMNHSYNLNSLNIPQSSIWFLWGFIPMFSIWLITCIAEVNRSPFDFAESESELVSGFNTEFSGGPFAFIFLSEYTNMLILSLMTVIMYTKFTSIILTTFLMMLIAFSLIWARGTLPRLRYDILMLMNWKQFLPTTTLLFLLILMFSFILF